MSATFQNLGFEVAGTSPGLASGWTLTTQARVEEIAGYGTPQRPAEDFERGWRSNDTFIFALAAVEPALYDSTPESVEDFEEGWSHNETALFDFDHASSEAADFNDGPGTKFAEDFEDHFAGNESFLVAFAPGNLAIGPLDGFESGWRSNQTFLLSFGTGDISVGPTESFESGWTTHMTTV